MTRQLSGLKTIRSQPGECGTSARLSDQTLPYRKQHHDQRDNRCAEPPVVAAASAELSVITKPEPQPVFGNTQTLRAGVTLEQQSLQMLNFWHEKSIRASEDYWSREPKSKPDDDPEYDVI